MATERVAAPPIPLEHRRSSAASTILADYWAMTKPEVTFLVVLSTAAGFYKGSPATLPDPPWVPLLHTLLGTTFIASGAAVLNQWAERRFDARMRRTARRPIAAGRIEPARALLSGMLLSVAGTAYLLALVGPLPALLAVGTLLGYLVAYTPSKRMTPLCTLIGAVPGALPPLIGWAAARGRLDPEAGILFAIVFLSQFPHFMAIAWMYQDDYDRAGYMVLPQGNARARLAAVQTLLPLVALLLLSLSPVLMGSTSMPWRIAAVLLNLGFLYYGAQFVRRRSGPAARQLLTGSIAYLPALLVLLVVW